MESSLSEQTGSSRVSPAKKSKGSNKLSNNSISSISNTSLAKKPMNSIGIKNPFSSSDETRISYGKNCVYQIGNEIGRGAFGVVYQAFNVETGDFVAVKRFPIKSIENDQLAAIESEIELMQKLNHPNIVHYFSTIKTKSFLYIVLEYMENGSLSHVIKKFGAFSESLTAIYVTQILSGLSYLHEQGVLHRDIKGANILTTKDGQVKLADFGVAVRLGDGSVDGVEVVGSPYWIAPEVIEMNTPTSACDIWSVGCLVIELLTGKPPYHDLAPLAAMFHIVQDDQPPLPKGASDTVKDFLLQCFNKDPSCRPSARMLLQHRWLQNSNAVANLKESELEASVSGLESSVANTIRMFRKISSSSRNPSSSRSGDADDGVQVNNLHLSGQQSSLPPSPVLDQMAIKQSPNIYDRKVSQNILSSNTRDSLWVGMSSPSPAYNPRQNYANLPLDSPLVGHGNYFEFNDEAPILELNCETEKPSPLTSQAKSTVESALSNLQIENQAQIELKQSPVVPEEPKKLLSLTALDIIEPIVEEDHSDRLRSSPDSVAPDGNLGDRSMEVNESNHQSIEEIGPSPLQKSRKDIAPAILTSVTLDEFDNLGRFAEAVEHFEPQLSPSIERGSPDELLIAHKKRSKPRIAVARGLIKDEKSASFRQVISPRHRPRTAKARLSGHFFRSRSPSSATSSARADSRPRNGSGTPVETAKIKIRSDSNRNLNTLLRDNSAKDELREAKELFRFISSMKPETPEKNLLVLCDQLSNIIENNPETAVNLVSVFGFSSIIDLFEYREQHTGHVISSIRYPVLKLINKIMENNIRVQEQLAIVGTIPKIARMIETACANAVNTAYGNSFSSASEQLTVSLGFIWPSAFQPIPVTFEPLILEAAKFLYMMSSASNQTVQGVITSGGLQILVNMISMGSLIMRPNVLRLLFSTYFINSPRKEHSKSAIDIMGCGTNESKLSHDEKRNTSLERKHVDHPFSFTLQSPQTTQSFMINNAVSEDAKQLAFLGIDSVIRICRDPSMMKREYCRLFVKYGLLHHLASTFFNVMTLYHNAFVTIQQTTPPQHISRESSSTVSSTVSLEILGQDSNSPKNSEIGGSTRSSSLKSNDADQSTECKYAFAIANIFYNYSRFDISTAEILSRHEPGNALWVILLFLSSPDLQIPPRVVVSSTTNNTGSTFTYLDSVRLVPVSPQKRVLSKDYDSVASNGVAGIVSSNIKKTKGESFSYPFSILSTTPTSNKASAPLSRSYMEIILLLLRTLKNLSAEASTSMNLERAGVLPTVIPLLNGPISDKCKNQVLACVYNLCRINKRRQEQVAMLGIVPYLLRVISKDKEVKSRQYAIPLLCSLAHASAGSRLELWKNDCVPFFLGILKDKDWQSFAFNSLVTWIVHDTEHVEVILVQPVNLIKLIEFFRMASPQTFRSIHQPLLDMMLKSPMICRSLGASGLFISSIMRRINGSEAMILCSLLRIIQLLHHYHSSPRQFVLDNDLYNVVKRLTKSEEQVLVYQMATRLMMDIQISTLSEYVFVTVSEDWPKELMIHSTNSWESLTA